MIAELAGDEGTGPPVVYIPGVDGTGELLLGTAARLAESFRLIRLRYTTTGPPPPGGDRYETLAASIVALLRERGAIRPVLLAESFGGAVALQTALDAPEELSGLVIVNSFAHYRPRFRLALTQLVAPLMQGPLFRLGRSVGGTWALLRPRRDRAVEEAFHALGGMAFNAEYGRRLTMIRGVDLRPRLPELRLPVALFASTCDRVVRSAASMREMASALPDATLEYLEGTGHVALPFDPDTWVRRVGALWKRAEARAAAS